MSGVYKLHIFCNLVIEIDQTCVARLQVHRGWEWTHKVQVADKDCQPEAHLDFWVKLAFGIDRNLVVTCFETKQSEDALI